MEPPVDFENVQKKAFIEALGVVPQEYAAARLSHIPIALVKGWYASDPDFNLACTEIKEHLLDTIEAKAYEQALLGSEKMIMYVLERQRASWNPSTDKGDTGPVKHRFFDFSGAEITGSEDGEDVIDGEFEEQEENGEEAQ
jgi:hypothetical protein